jgi:hypothetical protein
MHWNEPATSEYSHGELTKEVWDAAPKISECSSKGGDTRRLIYECFLGKLVMSEGDKGGDRSGAIWTKPKVFPEWERGGANYFNHGNTYYANFQDSVNRFDDKLDL